MAARSASDDPPGVWITALEPGDVGPGLRLGVKDLFDTAGLLTTYGSAVFAEHVPKRTAEAVSQLEAGGYAIVGKTNLHEFAYGTTNENPYYGVCPNPAAPGRVSGGSSGGNAAALVLGSVDAAIGTDSGGSIRIPAAYCGIAGFKPTYGLVSLTGCWPLAATFDHAGPMARNVPGCLAMMRALVPGWAPAELSGLGDVSVGVAWLDTAEPLVRARVEAAAALFPRRRELDFPRPEGAISFSFQWDVAGVHRELFAEHRELYSEELQIKLDRAMAITPSQAAEGEAARASYSEQAEAALEGVDLLLTPTMEHVAPLIGAGGIGDLDVRVRQIRNTLPFNSLGWPAFAVPCGTAEFGAPASIQIVGRPGSDALVAAAAAVLERALQLAPVASPAA